MRKYIICFIMLLCVSGVSYGYFRWHHEVRISPEEEIYIEDEDTQAVTAMDTTNAQTQMILEIYDEVTHTTKKNVSVIPASYIGLGRSELVEKINMYMANMPLDELEKGLISCDLMYFSKEYILLRKTYHPDEDFQKYYIKLNQGQVTVFYSDKKTVYEYTEISLEDLPLKVRSEVISGKEIRDEKALYDFLENYSS